ncbi:hypothetical protein FACS189498_2280 [Spirochaetia bacterium]|nr:hypothetical protein FACS189498_2280 [Spirochaetia bacterium]
MIALILICLTTLAYSQQILWTTARGTGEKIISARNVTSEVLKFYDLYDYYYDMTGYDKDQFIDTFDDGEGGWDWIYDINTFTVIAMKMPMDTYNTVVFVFYISKDAVDTIMFTDYYEDGGKQTENNRKQRFQTWLNTLMK